MTPPSKGNLFTRNRFLTGNLIFWLSVLAISIPVTWWLTQ